MIVTPYASSLGTVVYMMGEALSHADIAELANKQSYTRLGITSSFEESTTVAARRLSLM
jgi:hypothetical protein